MKRRRIEQEAADWRAGVVASVMANAFRGEASKAFEPSDFFRFPSLKPREEEPDQGLLEAKWQTYVALWQAKEQGQHQAGDKQ